MSDEIIPRRARKANDNVIPKLPDINSLLKSTAKPEFLQKNENELFIEKEKAHPVKIQNQPPPSSATIMKSAEIRKVPVIANAEESNKKYQNFANYLELRELAGETNEDLITMTRPPEMDPESEARRKSMYDLNKAPRDIAGGIHKNSRHIKKDQRKNIIKDKEKARRMKGQSSITTWKPDEFMKLRQNYD